MSTNKKKTPAKKPVAQSTSQPLSELAAEQSAPIAEQFAPTAERPAPINVEQSARNKERATKEAIDKTPMVSIVVNPVFGKPGEILTYRLNGATYHVTPGKIEHVPRALAAVIHDQVSRKKMTMQVVKNYIADGTGMGASLGELK